MRLLELQRRMLADVMRPATPSSADYIKPNDRLTSKERLGIYNRQYWLRLTDSLSEDFPGLRIVLGDRAFSKLLSAYLAACPSRSFTLRDLGAGLTDWLTANPGFAGSRLNLALDMLRLEWAHIETFDAANLKALAPEDLAELNPAMKLGLQPHIRLLQLNHPVDELRLRSLSLRAAIARRPAALFLATHRVDGDVYYRHLEAGEFALLRKIASGMPLVKTLSNVTPDQGDIQHWFAAWAQLGWLTHSSARRRGQ